MSQVIFARSALYDLERLGEFLRTKNTLAVKKVAVVIVKAKCSRFIHN
jgi:hypothetical protein